MRLRSDGSRALLAAQPCVRVCTPALRKPVEIHFFSARDRCLMSLNMNLTST